MARLTATPRGAPQGRSSEVSFLLVVVRLRLLLLLRCVLLRFAPRDTFALQHVGLGLKFYRTQDHNEPVIAIFDCGGLRIEIPGFSPQLVRAIVCQIISHPYAVG